MFNDKIQKIETFTNVPHPEKDGILTIGRFLTAKEVKDNLEAFLKTLMVNDGSEEYSLLGACEWGSMATYGASFNEDEPLEKKVSNFIVYATYGNCEGVIINIDFMNSKNQLETFWSAKFLGLTLEQASHYATIIYQAFYNRLY